MAEPRKYASLGVKLASFEQQINTRLKQVYEGASQNGWYEPKIVPKVQLNRNWREANKSDVSRQVRQNVIDGIKLEKIAWEGELNDVEFLARIFDLNSMPSTDPRYSTAADDIWQHRINNYDWPEDWVFDDTRFALKTGSDDNFLRFLCETIHPVVRPDRNQALKLAQQYNDQLRRDGWELVEEEKISGRPKFVAITASMARRSVTRAKSVADALNAGWMQKEIERLEQAVDKDPSLAIGTAKELVESCCKSILKNRGVAFTSSTDLPELVKLVTKELKLVPDDISDQAKGAETIRLLLRNSAAQVKYLAELRSLYGSGHGRDGKHRGLEPRHARLAVGAAVTFIDFITETYRQRENGSTKV
jgi:hypothetical protein